MAIRFQDPPKTDKPAQQQEKSPEIKLAVDLVVLDALVLQQKTSRIVGNLKQEDFSLSEDGVKQKISYFSQDQLPLSVILIVDRAGCLDPFSHEMRRATVEALSKLRSEDEVALMSFAKDVKLVQPFRYDRQRVIDALDRLPEHDEAQDGHSFNTAFYEAAEYMKKAGNPAGRRVIILITGVTTGFDASGPTAEETRNAIFESGSVVCGLIPASSEQRMESGATRGAAGIAKIFGAHTSSLPQLAEETGGEVMRDKVENIDKAFGTLVEHLRTRYSIGFVSTNPKRDGSFRKLKLDWAKPPAKDAEKLVIKTRSGYIAGNKAATDSKSKTKNH
jgi:Ca-activated chloride channel family protein